MVLTANGFELVAMIPMGDLDLQSKGAELPERAETLLTFSRNTSASCIVVSTFLMRLGKIGTEQGPRSSQGRSNDASQHRYLWGL
jgi:hypothetical protein